MSGGIDEQPEKAYKGRDLDQTRASERNGQARKIAKRDRQHARCERDDIAPMAEATGDVSCPFIGARPDSARTGVRSEPLRGERSTNCRSSTRKFAIAATCDRSSTRKDEVGGRYAGP